jgi:hypothetical protein
LETNLISQTAELKKIKMDLKKKVEKTKEQEISQLNVIDLTEINTIEMKVKQIRDNLIGIQFVKNSKDLDDLKMYISKNHCFNDELILQTLEKKLDIQFIILINVSNTKTTDKLKWDSSILLKEENEYKIMKPRFILLKRKDEMFSPKYFTIVEQVGNMFRLIYYCQKSIMTFLELPFDLRLLLIKSTFYHQEYHHLYSKNRMIYQFYDEMNKMDKN